MISWKRISEAKNPKECREICNEIFLRKHDCGECDMRGFCSTIAPELRVDEKDELKFREIRRRRLEKLLT